MSADSSNDRQRAGESYPLGTTARLLASDLVTPRTRAVLEARLHDARAKQDVSAPDAHPKLYNPRFFSETAFATLCAVVARLIPQTDGAPSTALARMIDARLSGGRGNGWRYDAMPPDGDAYVQGLRGIDESAQQRFHYDFSSLDSASQDALLRAIQAGDVHDGAWSTMPPARFFEELLAELVELHYAHPFTQDEIGYAGYADAHGWQAIGLNELEHWEPRSIPLVEAAPSNARTE